MPRKAVRPFKPPPPTPGLTGMPSLEVGKEYTVSRGRKWGKDKMVYVGTEEGRCPGGKFYMFSPRSMAWRESFTPLQLADALGYGVWED